ncbi:MAG: hypothetical protein RR459_03315 [Christensenellaceae bacterium]
MEQVISKNKRIGIIVGVTVAAIIILLAAVFLLSPTHLITMDVNPSISIETNRLGRVVSVTGINDDAKAVLANYDSKGKALEDVVAEIADLLVVNGYLQNGTQDVLVTVRNDGAATENVDKMNAAISDYMQKKGISANISSRIENFTAEDVARAEQNQMSVGKMLLLEHLSGGDQAVFEQLKSMNITELNKAAEKVGVDLSELDGKSLDAPLTQEDINEIFEADDDNDALEDQADIAKDEADALEDEAEVAADAVKEQADIDADIAQDAADEEKEKAAAAKDAAKDAEDAEKERVKTEAEEAIEKEEERKAEEEATAEEAAEVEEAAADEAAEAAEVAEVDEVETPDAPEVDED